MPDSYRNDLDAALVRAQALEAENKKLRQQREPEASPAPRSRRGLWTVVVTAALLAGLGLFGLLISIAGSRGLIIGVAFILTVAVALHLVRRLLLVCGPNEAMIISGRAYRAPDGGKIGYRVLFAGRHMLVPIIERADRLDLTAIPIEVRVATAYSKGGIPMNVVLSAAVKISSDPHLIGRAAERFLGRAREDIARVARETLEGHLRAIIAMTDVEDLKQDPVALVAQLHAEADDDLGRLGLQVDTITVQSVELE